MEVVMVSARGSSTTCSGCDHTHTAWSLNNLATVLAAQGDLNGARGLCERGLSIRGARLGPDHHEIADSLNNLAGILREQGDLDTARTLCERALAIREARLGPDHFKTAQSLDCDDLGGCPRWLV